MRVYQRTHSISEHIPLRNCVIGVLYSAISHFDLEPFDQQPTSLSAITTGNLYQADVAATDPTARVRGYGGTITCDNAAGYFDFSAEL